jgi:hypothetical protein
MIAVSGCEFAPPPDPNDPTDVELMEPKVMMRQLRWASDAANGRVDKGELTETRAKEMVAKEARTLIETVKLESIPQDQVWEYAELCRTGELWDVAAKLFPIAIQHAKETTNEDRRINDTLRFAHVLAQQGKVKEAIAMAKGTLTAKPTDRAPLLPAILLEVVPAAKGKKLDKELADLLNETIEVYDKTEIDITTQAGLDFTNAKPYLIRKAREVEAELRISP